MRRALLLILAFAGCRAPAQPNVGCTGNIVDPLRALQVADARLEDVTLWQAGFGAGYAQGDATLVVDDLDGVEHDFAARLDGNHYGLVADASDDETFGVPYSLVLPPNAQINARQLLGAYQGPHVGIDVGVGGQWRDLTNPTLVKLTLASLSFGVGFVPATWESLDVELWNDPLHVVPPCNSDADCDADTVCRQGLCGVEVGGDEECVNDVCGKRVVR